MKGTQIDLILHSPVFQNSVIQFPHPKSRYLPRPKDQAVVNILHFSILPNFKQFEEDIHRKRALWAALQS